MKCTYRNHCEIIKAMLAMPPLAMLGRSSGRDKEEREVGYLRRAESQQPHK
jgi:hypothetical protein